MGKNSVKDKNLMNGKSYPETQPVDSSKFYITKINKGSGSEQIPFGSRVAIKYAGYFENDTKFDPIGSDGRTIDFVVGSTNVIKCWNLGVQ